MVGRGDIDGPRKGVYRAIQILIAAGTIEPGHQAHALTLQEYRLRLPIGQTGLNGFIECINCRIERLDRPGKLEELKQPDSIAVQHPWAFRSVGRNKLDRLPKLLVGRVQVRSQSKAFEATRQCDGSIE